MKDYNIKHILLCISVNDLVDLNILKSNTLSLIRLNSNELSKIISKILETNVAEINVIDFSYYGIVNDEIIYEVKFYIEGNK